MKNQRHQNANEFKNLGFVSHRNPAQDFQKPPGMLGLKLMHKFAEDKKDVFNKLVMESTYRSVNFRMSFRVFKIFQNTNEKFDKLLPQNLKSGQIIK